MLSGRAGPEEQITPAHPVLAVKIACFHQLPLLEAEAEARLEKMDFLEGRAAALAQYLPAGAVLLDKATTVAQALVRTLQGVAAAARGPLAATVAAQQILPAMAAQV